jgi:hypothetical protein
VSTTTDTTSALQAALEQLSNAVDEADSERTSLRVELAEARDKLRAA